ncbi:MAG TPA: GGDEF domain-containing protein [Terracidiphilus sp.]|nr:GGDEF domain-containing protein [Terracidiphilus sp.]
MRLLTPSLPPGQPDPALVRGLVVVQRICLGLVFFIPLLAVSAQLFPQVGPYLGPITTNFSFSIAIIAVLCALSLIMSDPGSSWAMRQIGHYFAVLPALGAASILVLRYVSLGGLPGPVQEFARAVSDFGDMSSLSAGAFLYLSVVIFLMRSDSVLARRLADILVSILCLLALALISQDLFGTLSLFGLTSADLISPQVLSSILLLTAVITLRQAQFGVFSIFLGHGIGSRIARGFAPILLLWPFLREIGEAQIVFPSLIPAHFATALLTSLAVACSLGLLLFIVWRINGMEKEIHDLTLRDELTGLYNMRGFYLLAEQTLRIAQRSKMPFSVLFLDLDGLKKINDTLGHNVGSKYLAKTGEVIATNFRDSDVKGRFGGDEFVVAGQFSMVGIEIAALRLKTVAKELSKQVDPRFPLSFSIGHVTVEHFSTESLKDLVTRADHVMYEDKRARKAVRV